MIDELSSEFAPDAPRQPAQPRAARRKDQRELRGHIEIFGDDPHAAFGYVRDRAIARQRADPELYLCRPVTGATLAFSPFRKHPDPPEFLILLSAILSKTRWTSPKRAGRNL